MSPQCTCTAHRDVRRMYTRRARLRRSCGKSGGSTAGRPWTTACSRGRAEALTMIRNEDVQRDTPAWIFQGWASFALAVGTTAAGIVYMPLDPWVRAFFAMGLLFSVGSSLTLSKT